MRFDVQKFKKGVLHLIDEAGHSHSHAEGERVKSIKSEQRGKACEDSCVCGNDAVYYHDGKERAMGKDRKRS